MKIIYVFSKDKVCSKVVKMASNGSFPQAGSVPVSSVRTHSFGPAVSSCKRREERAGEQPQHTHGKAVSARTRVLAVH